MSKSYWVVYHPVGLTFEFGTWREARAKAQSLANFWSSSIRIVRFPTRRYKKGRRAAVIVRPKP